MHGLVHRVIEVVESVGSLSVITSRATTLDSEFALIFLVQCLASHVAPLQHALQAAFPTFHFFSKITNLSNKEGAAGGMMYRFALTAPDTPGIVRNMTSVFLSAGANIRNMQTELSSAPFAGYPLLHMRADITVQHKDQVKALRKALEKLEEDGDCDVTLKAATSPTDSV